MDRVGRGCGVRRLADCGAGYVTHEPRGYRGADDWNARLPKSRLPAEALFTDL